MSGGHPSPIIDLTFPHHWQAQILSARPLILPNRHFVYPRDAEEVSLERSADVERLACSHVARASSRARLELLGLAAPRAQRRAMEMNSCHQPPHFRHSESCSLGVGREKQTTCVVEK